MVAAKLDGREVAASVRNEVKSAVAEMVQKGLRPPKLAIVMVGDRPDSAAYVKMKEKACVECGIAFHLQNLPADVGEESVAALMKELNADDSVDGFFVQLPLPPQLNAKRLISLIDGEKDVDGLTSTSMGRLLQRDATFVPCTAAGIIRILDYYQVVVEGKTAVVLGRSEHVGLPVFQLLQQRNATVTLCHSKTKDIETVVRGGDIVIAAIGKPNFVKGNWLKPGCVVVDVGINIIPDSSRTSGTRMVGDVDFDACREVASFITPVPGGVGPMTVASLMVNVLRARNQLEGI